MLTFLQWEQVRGFSSLDCAGAYFRQPYFDWEALSLSKLPKRMYEEINIMVFCKTNFNQVLFLPH